MDKRTIFNNTLDLTLFISDHNDKNDNGMNFKITENWLF